MSGNSNQRTLFQTWGSSLSQSKVAEPRRDVKAAAGRSSSSIRARVAPGVPPHNPAPNPLWTEVGHRPTPGTSVRTEEDDDDDDLMLVAVYEAEKSLQSESGVRTTDPGLSPPPSGVQTYYPDFPGFDSSSAKVWIYPTNYPVREYQLKMSEAALFQNTLVCLPTGLGKTFIAAVVMYNFYRWYPCGKIVFMAPTKPLVAQQIEACYKVMGIPQSHMAELTGTVAAKNRQEVWRTKRVFFLTPQVMMNDLSRDTCPAQQVKCVVIDEAHKGLGNHAYCQVVRQLLSHTQQFRILALSATPGGDTKSVQSVISNLLISHIELRSEESPDIQAHSHQRSVEKVVVPLGDVLSAYQARYLQVLEKFMSRLVQYRVMAHKDLRTLCKYQLILARDQFRKNPPPSIKGYQLGMLEGDFALCISLYHGYELLMQMGLRSLFFYIQSIVDGSRENSRAKNELQRTPTFMDLYQEMEAMFVQSSAGPDDSFIYSHPKLEKLEEVVLQHFRRWKESSAENRGSSPEEVSTRVMIFSSFRESVQEIAVMLNRHAPLIRVMTFMGQASAGKGVKGFTQKEQLEVVHRFRQGGFNTLVSTCVGEEGLDIGEVDLIACFDAQKNPIRLVQRMGRTGRKRQGRIVVVLAEGKEERTYNQSQSNKRSVYKSITSNRNGFHMYQNSPRMIPDGVNPVLHKMHITCGQFDHGESGRRSSRGRRSHAEGRASLIHPHNLFQQSRATSDGFLSSTEYSLWASTMRLDEQEAQPTLKQSRFLSIPDALSPQEEVSKGQAPSRELSLWEWRLWQHKPLPTNAVDHSLRCSHFVQVMKLIDGMKEENESKLTSDLDSPVAVSRKRTTALNTSEETEAEADSDDDFQNESTFTRRRRTHRGEQQQTAQAKTVCGKGREFLDEEAVLSEDEDGADVSSDEEEKEEHERFLKGFVVDNNTHLSQGLNDSEMHGVYLKSVRSPAGHGKYKMSYRNHHRMDVFSQVLELDETYAEDSFVVGSDEEEPNISETEPEAVELMPEASDADGRKQYATRRRVFLHRVRTNARTNDRAGAEREPQQKAAVKRSRIIHIHDSSEDETEGSGKEKRLAQQQEAASSASSKLCLITEAQIHTRREVQINERCRYALENQHSLSNELDFAESDKCLSSKKPPQEIPTTSSASVSESSSSSSSTVCILVDSRCLSSAVDLMTSLRQRHGASVHVCSLDGSYFIVSSRMAVERHSQAALAAAQNRKRLSERVSALQASFDRVCLIVERERNKTGGASRPFQPTRFYDSTVAALVSAGVRLLWSDGEEQSAALLVELARLEQRKGQGIAVPLQVKGQHRQQALQLYLSLPSINYIQALNMSHNFLSVAQLINSSVEEIQQRGRMSRSRAEEMYRFLRYSCDSFLISTPKAAKTS
ncbi:Fanconi anemia group M protein isoform X2 [Gouania willdenowi]|uniref:Fanconi anemia group M protein isoform X2 n=1 Tax=Gouania willdenowi TaxID=441366 RepID=UPI0010568801|nr:Fanconi anemia group M protein isoform X2 [Gouania willdenowi]